MSDVGQETLVRITNPQKNARRSVTFKHLHLVDADFVTADAEVLKPGPRGCGIAVAGE